MLPAVFHAWKQLNFVSFPLPLLIFLLILFFFVFDKILRLFGEGYCCLLMGTAAFDLKN